MTKITLDTISFNNCTVGKLYVDGVLLCYTIEKPWKNNEPMISCVPAGVYELNPCKSHRFGDTYCLENTDLGVSLHRDTKRTNILFHKAVYFAEYVNMEVLRHEQTGTNEEGLVLRTCF